MKNDEKKTPPRPSRGEVETLCILHAVGTQGCRAGDLAGRLGLSATLAGAVAACTEPLVLLGWLDQAEDRVSLTVAGHALLTRRLAELGVG